MAKNNQKCVRLSDRVLQIVEAYRGDGFNEKFENLVIDMDASIPEREKRLADLDEKIEIHERHLRRVVADISNARCVKVELEKFLKSLSV